MFHVEVLVFLLATGSFAAGANPNDLSDLILSRALDYVLGNTWTWMRLPPISVNSSLHSYDASAEPFPTFDIANISRNGLASFETTDFGRLLSFNLSISHLKTGYQIISHDVDGECKFVQFFESVDNNFANLKILILPFFNKHCSGTVHSFRVEEFVSMEQLPDPVLCGDKSRDMILKELSGLHQTDIHDALQIYVPLAAMEALKDVNMCP